MMHNKRRVMHVGSVDPKIRGELRALEEHKHTYLNSCIYIAKNIY